jgi:hypothetical protein
VFDGYFAYLCLKRYFAVFFLFILYFVNIMHINDDICVKSIMLNIKKEHSGKGHKYQ